MAPFPSCIHGNEFTGSVKGEEFLVKVSDYRLFEKDPNMALFAVVVVVVVIIIIIIISVTSIIYSEKSVRINSENSVVCV